MTRDLHCSFCQKSEHEVEKLVAGPGVYICDTCVATADRIMRNAGPPAPATWWRRLVMRVRGSEPRFSDRLRVAPGATPLG